MTRDLHITTVMLLAPGFTLFCLILLLIMQPALRTLVEFHVLMILPIRHLFFLANIDTSRSDIADQIRSTASLIAKELG